MAGEVDEANPKHKRIIKIIQILLTLFYGQFIANGIYDHLIRGVPELIKDPNSYYNIFKVTVGIIILAISAYSVIILWLRKKVALLIFISAVLLIVVFLIVLIINIIDFVQRKDRFNEQETPVQAAILTIESIFRVIAIILTFLLVKLIKQKYEPVNTSNGGKDDDDDNKEKEDKDKDKDKDKK